MMGSTHPQAIGTKMATKFSIILSSFLLLYFCFLEPIHYNNSSRRQKVTPERKFGRIPFGGSS
ncbi:MAG: hypothetical protein J6O23_07290, partial [Prevotella sp.]|nr:hypothetical protein [Prevotella sp.]